jgi:hypothetical protein
MKTTDQCPALIAEGKQPLAAEVDDFDNEIALARQNKELMELLDERPRDQESYSLAEARRLLGLDSQP